MLSLALSAVAFAGGSPDSVTVGDDPAATSPSDTIGQEQACAGEASQIRDVPMSAVRVIETIGSHEGSVVTLDVDGERATCRVDSDFNVLEVSFGAPGDGA